MYLCFMHNVKLSTDKSLDKGQKIDIDFDIITHENAFMYKYFDKSYSGEDQYIGKIHSGITKDKGRYFFFEHSIVDRPKVGIYSDPNSWHSYHIHQITPELFERISRGDAFTLWDVKFDSFYYFGKYILSVRRGSYVENSVFYSKLEGDTLTIPYGTSPSDLSMFKPTGVSIGNFLKWHQHNYKGYNDLILNKAVIRESLLERILSSDF